MSLPTKPPTFPSRSREGSRTGCATPRPVDKGSDIGRILGSRDLVCHRRIGATRGYALLAVMLMATVLLIALTAALPSVYQEGQREREEELIFRGGQYARAIALFRRQFRRYPTEVKELLQTNGMRFLRKAYPDPMSRKGKWRFIHANAAGVLLDSKLQAFTPRPGGSTGTVGGLSQNPSAGSTGGMSSRTSSAFFGEGQEIKGAFIVGVASASHKESIRVWNKRTRYDEWEFLGVEMNPLGLPGATFTFGQAGGTQMPSGSAPPGQSSTPAGPPLPPQPSAPGESGQQPAPDQP